MWNGTGEIGLFSDRVIWPELCLVRFLKSPSSPQAASWVESIGVAAETTQIESTAHKLKPESGVAGFRA
jgi:hypothetical protein